VCGRVEIQALFNVWDEPFIPVFFQYVVSILFEWMNVNVNVNVE